MTTTEPNKRDLVVTRVFNAPVKQVWKAWSEPELVMRWWGPNGFTYPVARMDFREGGTSDANFRSNQCGDASFDGWTALFRKNNSCTKT